MNEALAEITVDPPPPVPRPAVGAAMGRAVPAVTAMLALGAVAAVVASGSSPAHNPVLLMFPVTMVLSALVSTVVGGGRHRGTELGADRRRYLAYLTTLSARLDEHARQFREQLITRHPEPAALWTVAGSESMWMTRRDDPDFGVVRVGVGAVPAATLNTGPESAGELTDPVTATALARLLDAHRLVPELPVTVSLAGARTVAVAADVAATRALLRAVICQLAASHHPADLGVAAVLDALALPHWDWLKWLPHHQHPHATDHGGTARMSYRDAESLRHCDGGSRHLLVVVDHAGPAPVAGDAMTLIHIGAADTRADLRIEPSRGPGARLDQMSVTTALATARRLAAYGRVAACDDTGWLSRIAGGDLDAVAPKTLWHSDTDPVLRVPIGTDAGGVGVDLDIREAAVGGMGPHGLCIGATGSGKSELLRTIVLGMIARHSPEQLNLILVDFKGGATFLGLAATRHVSAVITNLADEAYLVDRMHDALRGEIDRRQRILRAAGEFAGIAEYRAARRAGAPLDPLPTLFIVIDEFSELLSQHPDFADMFVAIGRLGRSLGMHLLLASQRVDEGRLRGLDANLAYRICLKTLSAGESRTAIGVPDAYQLPARPGAAYLRIGAAEPVRFHAAFVSGRTAASGCAPRQPRVFTETAMGPMLTAPGSAGPSLLDIVVDRFAGHGPAAHGVWLPPLTESPSLGTLLDADFGDLRVPIGLVDRTFEHRRVPLVVDLSGAAGNTAVIGGPQSGKSTVLQTLMTALAATHDAARVAFYVLDFGGGELASTAVLPHVGAVAGRADGALAVRIVTELIGVLRTREKALRRGRDGESFGEVFLVVDGWAAIRGEHPDIEAAVTAIATEGLALGVHVMLAASRWADIRPALRDQLGTRLELRLGDPSDSEIDRNRARQVPARRPGHGICPDGSPMVIALPTDCDPLPSGGRRATPIRLLPERITHQELMSQSEGHPGIVVGIDENRLRPVTVDFAGSHLLVLGEPGCGKTAVLRLLCAEIARTAPDAEVVLVDPRRSLGGSDPGRLERTITTLRSRLSDPQPPGETFVVVDDYDLAATAVMPLAELLPHARDIGLHLIVARRSGGAARALYEPVPAGLRELGAMSLQMSAHPDDGPLLAATRPRALPPGRAVLCTRAEGERVIQVAWLEPR